MEAKGESTKTLMLPEETIQHIQSFMSGREAARSSILSKSWHSAWLTRPSIDLDEYSGNFVVNRNEDGSVRGNFVEIATKTVQRYLDSNLKIESFKLRSFNYYITCKFIVDAIRAGATDVELEAPRDKSLPYLPQEVLASESLLRLSLSGFRLIEDCVISCSRLKSLTLRHARVSADWLDDIISSCLDSLEELSLLCQRLSEKQFGLHKLRRLDLNCVVAPAQFFTDFASRFPSLKDLTILKSIVPSTIHISSNSLETITFKTYRKITLYKATFDVPNIRRFTFSGIGLPPLSINGGSREWELDMTISCDGLYNGAWFLKLKKVLKKFSLSRIVSLNLKWDHNRSSNAINERENDIEVGVGVEPLVVENLSIDAPIKVIFTLLLRLFRICRPKFVTSQDQHCEGWGILRKRLMHIPISRNCGMPEQYVFGQFGLKKVIYEEFDDREKHLDSFKTPRKNRFKLIWD